MTMLETISELEAFFHEGDIVAATLVCSFLFVLGAVSASFSCLVAYRLKTLDEGQSVLSAISFPPSHCEGCGRRLGVLELVPILGWLACRGRCPSCGARIPARYPIMEFLLGAACASSPFVLASFAAAAAATVVLVLGFLIAVIDWENSMVPEELTWVLLFAGLLASPVEPELQYRVVGAAIGAVLGWAMTTVPGWWKGVDTRAWGDVAMAAGVGAWMGCFAVAPLCVAAAAVHLVVCLAYGGKGEEGGTWTPFGPALMTSFAIAAMTYPAFMGLVRPEL
jgi:leader peptidase (prepilin peptidase)/N-methyltransferase